MKEILFHLLFYLNIEETVMVKKILFTHIKHLSKNYKRIILQVRISNEIAISLYKSLGFKVNKVSEKYYENEENTYEMIKNNI